MAKTGEELRQDQMQGRATAKPTEESPTKDSEQFWVEELTEGSDLLYMSTCHMTIGCGTTEGSCTSCGAGPNDPNCNLCICTKAQGPDVQEESMLGPGAARPRTAEDNGEGSKVIKH